MATRKYLAVAFWLLGMCLLQAGVAEACDLDLDIVHCPENEEESPGGYMGLNHDDDNANDVTDYNDGVGQGHILDYGDFRCLLIYWTPIDNTNGTITLTATAGVSKIKAWRSYLKTSPPLISTGDASETFTLTQEDNPIEVWVEGVAASDSDRDITFTAIWSGSGGSPPTRTLKLTVVYVDIDIEDPAVAEKDEATGVVLTVDSTRRRVVLKQTQPSRSVILRRTSSSMTVWDAETGGNEITFVNNKKQFAAGEHNVYVEAEAVDTQFSLVLYPEDVPETKYWVTDNVNFKGEAVRVKLGGSKAMTVQAPLKVYVPTKWGGRLALETTAGTISDLKYPDGSPYDEGSETGEDKHGWYTFKVTGSTDYTVSSAFVQDEALTNTPWCTFWWPYDQQVGGGPDWPRMWQDPAPYGNQESAALNKYDAVNPGTTAFDYEDTNFKCNHGPNCTAGHCDAAAHAGFYVAKPTIDKEVGGQNFRVRDRLAIAVQRYWIGGGPDTDTGTAQQYFKRSFANLTDAPDWFHKKLRQRIHGDQGGVIVRWNNWNMGVYEYEATFVARGTTDADAKKVDIENELTRKTFSWTDGTQTHDTSYAISYWSDGTVNAGISWNAVGRPDTVYFSKASGQLCNDQVNDSKAKADSIIAP